MLVGWRLKDYTSLAKKGQGLFESFGLCARCCVVVDVCLCEGYHWV